MSRMSCALHTRAAVVSVHHARLLKAWQLQAEQSSSRVLFHCLSSLQVPTLLDVLVGPTKPAGKGLTTVTNTSSNSSSSSKPSSKSSSKSSRASASAEATTDNSKPGVLVVKETAAGFNLCCPAGQYRLILSHPAVRHMLGQLLELRSRLQQLQQQVKQRQELQQQQFAAANAARVSTSSAIDVKTAGKLSSTNGAGPAGSRASSPLPPGEVTPGDAKRSDSGGALCMLLRASCLWHSFSCHGSVCGWGGDWHHTHWPVLLVPAREPGGGPAAALKVA